MVCGLFVPTGRQNVVTFGALRLPTTRIFVAPIIPAFVTSIRICAPALRAFEITLLSLTVPLALRTTSGLETSFVFFLTFFLVTSDEGQVPLVQLTVIVEPLGKPFTVMLVNFVCLFVEAENAKPSVIVILPGAAGGCDATTFVGPATLIVAVAVSDVTPPAVALNWNESAPLEPTSGP